MSSPLRRLQKKIAISMGYHKKLRPMKLKGSEEITLVSWVYDSKGEPHGLRWPQVKAPTKGIPDVKRT
jgi:hypothetical protein